MYSSSQPEVKSNLHATKQDGFTGCLISECNATSAWSNFKSIILWKTAKYTKKRTPLSVKLNSQLFNLGDGMACLLDSYNFICCQAQIKLQLGWVSFNFTFPTTSQTRNKTRFPIVPMWVLNPLSVHAWQSCLSPINTSGHFSVQVSAKTPIQTTPNLWRLEVLIKEDMS